MRSRQETKSRIAEVFLREPDPENGGEPSLYRVRLRIDAEADVWVRKGDPRAFQVIVGVCRAKIAELQASG